MGEQAAGRLVTHQQHADQDTYGEDQPAAAQLEKRRQATLALDELQRPASRAAREHCNGSGTQRGDEQGPRSRCAVTTTRPGEGQEGIGADRKGAGSRQSLSAQISSHGEVERDCRQGDGATQ